MDAPAVATRPCASHRSSSTREPADSLQEAAFDLSEIHQRRNGIAHILQKIGAQDAMLAGEPVDLHFAYGRAVREIVEWLAGRGFRVEMNFRSPIVTVREERHAMPVSGFHDLRQFNAVRHRPKTRPSSNRTDASSHLSSLAAMGISRD